MDKVNQEIWTTYKKLKEKIKISSQEKNTNKCLQNVTNLWMFMNRFRNCDLKLYFDEDIYSWISDLNPTKQNNYPHKLKTKKEFRIAARDKDKKVKSTANNWIKYTENEEVRVKNLALRREYIQSQS